jgi:pimeloyl-ACP methyl ester carboxylesterase
MFAGHFGAKGQRVLVPDLALPNLSRLSVDQALQRVVEVLNECGSWGPMVVIGSSFGGFLAVRAITGLQTSVAAKVEGLVLLAPVLYPWHPHSPIVSQAMEDEWLSSGSFPIEEGSTGQLVPVHFPFLEELKRHAGEIGSVDVRTLVVHGLRDERVPHQHSVEFVGRTPCAKLISLDEDHQMFGNPHGLVTVVDTFVQSLKLDDGP